MTVENLPETSSSPTSTLVGSNQEGGEKGEEEETGGSRR
jgi:hypothetical protein